MKLHEVLDPDVMATRLDVLNKDKSESTKTLIKLLRARANRSNRKTPKTRQISTFANHDGMAGYTGASQTFIDQTGWDG